MPLVPISLATRSNPARYGHEGATRLVNAYAENAGEDAKSPLNIHAVDGLSAFASLSSATGGVRAALALSDAELYAVIGRGLFRIDPAGSATLLGGIPTDGLVTMARNRESPPVIAIASRGLVYYLRAGVLTQNTDAELPPVNSVTGLDGYFVFLCDDGRRFASGLDSTEVSALDFASAESNPDPGVRVATRGRDLVTFGTRSCEFDQNNGGETWPFQRTTAIEVGCKAAASVATIDQTLAWVAHDNTVRILDGYQAKEISTHAVVRFIESHGDPSQLSATSWYRSGHTFYALSGANGTWVYDLKTGDWHERKSYGMDRWRCGLTVPFANRILAGDYASPTLYILDPDAYDEDGTDLVMTVQLPPVHGWPYRMVHQALHVDVVPGVGIVTATEYLANPQLMMDYSDDGGATWSTQRFAALGRAGDRLRRVRFNRLGMSRSRIYRLSISAAVARSIVSAAVEADKAAA